uniref:Neurobeachin-like protein 2 n=1 Tax=Ornithorhynchus anatinus TaxID=9258 RepID=A0A6I8PRN1_ORNAN
AVGPGSVGALLGVLRGWSGPPGPPGDPRLLRLVLRGLVAAVHLLHGCGAPRRGPELRALLDGYFHVLNADRAAPAHPEEGIVTLRIGMLDAIPRMLDCEDRPTLQADFLGNNCFEHIIRLVQNSQVGRGRGDAIAVHAVAVLTAIMSNSPSAKEVFKERIGYSHLFEVLRCQGPPTRRLLQELLNMAAEGDHAARPPPAIRNEQPLLVLARWLPALPSPDLRVFLAERLRALCDAGPRSRSACVRAGMVDRLLEALGAGPGPRCADHLLQLLRALGGVSLRPAQLRRLFRLLWPEAGRAAHPLAAPVVRALSGMARREGPDRALRYFDLTPGMAGIAVPPIQRWPGAGFSFHAWLCLNREPASRLRRRQLYSFFTPGGTGFEAFFTAGGTLVVAVCTKKEYMTVALPEFPFKDSAWHSVAVVHVAGRRPFGQNLVHVYADGRLLRTAQLRCPSLGEAFSSCCIGSAGHRTTTTAAGPGPAAFAPPARFPDPPFPAHPLLARSRSFPAALAGRGWAPGPPAGPGTPQEGGVTTTVAGGQDTEWGSPTSLEGQLGSVAVFHEALQASHVKNLHASGPNETSPFKPDSELHELSGKLLLYYTPQACRNNICLDLAPGQSLDGRLTGHKVVNWDVKVGGGRGTPAPSVHSALSTERLRRARRRRTRRSESTVPATETIPTPRRAHEGRLERNGVAAFLLMVKNFLRGHPVNQDGLIQCHGPAIIGALLQKVPSHAMDMNVLVAAQMLMEQVASDGHGPLLHLLYQHLLFDFSLWRPGAGNGIVSGGDLPCHIQYLSGTVKDHRQRVRRKYGVQYILDSVRTHYSPRRERPLAADDLRTVQTSLLGLAKDFLARGPSPEELHGLLGYLAGTADQGQACGALDVMLDLLKGSPAQDQLGSFLLEPGNVEVLFALLVRPSASDGLRDRLFKVQEVPGSDPRSAPRLPGGLGGVASLLRASVPSPGKRGWRPRAGRGPGPTPSARIGPGARHAAGGFLAPLTRVSSPHFRSPQLFHLIYGQPDVVRQLARQVGWQDTLTRLYVREAPPDPPAEPADVFLPPASPPGPGPGRDPSEGGSRSSSRRPLHQQPPGQPRAGGGGPRNRRPSPPSAPLPSDPGAPPRPPSRDGTGEPRPGCPRPLRLVPPAGRQQAPEEELSNLLTNILFSLTWRGVEGGDEAAWRERGQVFSVLTKLGAAGELVRPPDEIKRSLLEMMVESALSDLHEAVPATLPALTQHVLKLLRLLQDFLSSEGHANQGLWSEKVGPPPSPRPPGPDRTLRTALRTQRAPDKSDGIEGTLHALAHVKLHGLLQTATPPRRQEACYLLAKLEAPLARALEAKSERCSWLVPLVRALLDRAYAALGLQWGLPSLPPTNGSPTFYEDFQAFCASPEWRAFIDKQVQPTMSQFEMDTYAKSHDLMSNFWNSCYDALLSSAQRREKERAESRAIFQEQVLEPARQRVRMEGLRYGSVQKQLASQHATVLLHWAALRRLLTAPCSAWADRDPPPTRWKLSSAETYSRMRLKLVPSHHFDQHSEASALRDNLGADHLAAPTDSLPLAVAKEARVNALEEDHLGKEELAIAEPKEPGEQGEKLVLSEECQLITIVATVPGRLEVTTQNLYFYDGSSEKEETEEGIGYDFRRPLGQLREVHLRRYNLRRSALEFFFIDQANYFLNFPRKVRNKVYSCILGLRPPSQGYFGNHSPQEMLKASGLTQKWVNREISNFEYLMQLNTIAGRTYNDLSQYPVFPWILRDYVSDTLDLDDPSVFRDLSKPIGVVNARHRQLVREKYESFEDPTGAIDKFHYGTHYSNAAGVMHYLIRTEPFTSLHIQLQSGRFDCSDRQFHSVPAAWQARLESPADVKELIPEFFYFPDFLENQNGFDLGSLQLTNEKVGDVVLPRWARSREDFIHKHRQALESEHVSAHLHEWIDLIFGYKQRGPAAVDALNVFYYCTYEGAVDLDAVADETERKALEGIISNFGQTPCQLLREPHPTRLSAEDAAQRLARLDTYSPNVFQDLGQLKAFFVEGISDGVPLAQAVVPHRQARSFITQGSPDLLVTVSANGLLGTHSWLPYDRTISNYFTFCKDPTVGNARYGRGPPARVPDGGVSGKALAVAPDGKLLFSGGHWDCSLRVTSLPRGRLLCQLIRHIDVVTCLALDLCGIYLISGSRDTTCLVWQVVQEGGLSVRLAPKPVQVLYGHVAAVSCVAISTELDVAVSGSEDGAVILHTVRRGQFVASLRPPGGAVPGPVGLLAVGPEGQIVVQSSARERPGAKESCSLHLYSVNGRLLESRALEERPTALLLAETFVLLGTAQCALHILHLHSLDPAAPPLPMKVPVHSVAITKEHSHVLVGLADGKLIVVGAGQPSEVRSGQFARRLWRSTRRISQVSSGETEYNPPEPK